MQNSPDHTHLLDMDILYQGARWRNKPASTSPRPCRSCLRKFRTGEEERLLFTYNPFSGLDPYPSPGPVFIHREECPSYETPGFPEELRDLPLTFEAYGKDRWIVGRERASNGGIEPAIERLLGDPEVEYIHVRNTEAGCFIAQVERI